MSSEDLQRLIDIILEGLRVFNRRDGLGIREEVLRERANNIVMGIQGDFELKRLPEMV